MRSRGLLGRLQIQISCHVSAVSNFILWSRNTLYACPTYSNCHIKWMEYFLKFQNSGSQSCSDEGFQQVTTNYFWLDSGKQRSPHTDCWVERSSQPPNQSVSIQWPGKGALLSNATYLMLMFSTGRAAPVSWTTCSPGWSSMPTTWRTWWRSEHKPT